MGQMRLIHASPEGYIGRGGTDVLGGARQRYPSVRLRLPPPLDKGGVIVGRELDGNFTLYTIHCAHRAHSIRN